MDSTPVTHWENIAKASAKWRRENIALIPDDCSIDPQYLGSLTNGEFIAVFKEIQKLMIRLYEDAEKAPFEWGYPQENNTEELRGVAYNRISDFFMSLAKNGSVSDGILTVNRKAYKATLKKHKNIDCIINKLKHFNFVFVDDEKKTETFTVSYPENSLLFHVLQTYANSNAQDFQCYQTGADYFIKFGSFSYRWIEDPKKQNHEPLFLMTMDMSSKELQAIGYWLYDKAKEYGFTIDRKKPFDKGSLYYTKGSKSFLQVGENYDRAVFTKVIFRKVFETNPDDIKELMTRYPDSFGRNTFCQLCNGWGSNSFDTPCAMRITYDLDGKTYRCCAYRSFYFNNPTLEDVELILKLYMIENKIK